MNVLFLLIAVLVLIFSLRRMTLVEERKRKSVIQEIKQNTRLLLYGMPILAALAFIPYQVWVLTGKSNDWDGVYIIGGTSAMTLIFSFIFYYKRKLKFN